MAKVDILNYISDDNILRSTYDTDTNELDITDVPQNLNSIITLGGGGGSVTVEELNVSANGTYTAPEGKAYSPVNVSIVSDYGALVDGSYSGILDISSATKVKGYGLAYLTNATGIKAPNVTSIGTYALTGSSALTVIAFPSVTNVDSNAFRQMNELTTTDLGSTLTTIGNNAWSSSSKFNTLIIRKNTVQSIANIGMFNGTCFASDGTGGILYVPESLITSYQSATNWSTLLAYTNNQIKKIEGTIYETQYADGTPIGA